MFYLDIDCSNVLKVLGATIEDHLKLNKFISRKVQVCNFHIRNFYNIKQRLNFSTKTILVTNMIISTLDYGNLLLLGSTEKDLRPLHLILNKAIRFIYDLNIREHITPYYNKLHILPVRKRIIFKACLTAHKIFNRQSPSYLHADFQNFMPLVNMELRTGAGRDKSMFELLPLRKGREVLYEKIKKEWNVLPLQIRNIEKTDLFKRKLKSYLFK